MPHHPQALRDRTDDRGFTLIELVVVVVILGVLAAVAVPSYLDYQKGAKDAAAESDLRNALVQIEQCRADNGWYPGALGLHGRTNKLDWCDLPTAQYLHPSASTVVTYFGSGGDHAENYLILTKASGGTDASYCYSNVTGGAIKKLAKDVSVTSFATACP